MKPLAKRPLKVAPVVDGEVMIPLRDAAEILGFKISWNNEKWSAIVEKDNKVVEVKADSEGAKY